MNLLIGLLLTAGGFVMGVLFIIVAALVSTMSKDKGPIKW